MNARVTWLLPVKNGMPYLLETLASIEAQTYRDWEVLAWDNGSTDGTIETLHMWIPSRLPGRVVTKKPMGLGACLAKMVYLSNTELCARIDADDINFPERLERQVEFLLNNPEIAVVGTQVKRIDSNNQVYPGLYHSLPLNHFDIVNYMLFSHVLWHPTILFRRSVILEIGNYRDISPVEDYELWLRISTKFKLANMNLPLLYYRVHDNSVTKLAEAERSLEEKVNVWFCEYAPQIFGCSRTEASLLRQRRHPCAIRLLYQIAKHLQRSRGGDLVDILKSESFLNAGRHLVSSRDIMSRLALALLDRRRSALPEEILKISKDTLKFFGLHKVVAAVHH